jgi:hypothetical protein
MNHPPEHWERVALEKLIRVLGEHSGRTLYAHGLRELGLDTLRSPQELHRLAQWLTRQPGFAATVGGLLSVHAVINGATAG